MLSLIFVVYAYARGLGGYWIGLATGGIAIGMIIIGAALYATSRKPRPNLQFRRCGFGTVLFGHESDLTGYKSIIVEVGNETHDKPKPTTDAFDIRASITYLGESQNTLHVSCPGYWVSRERIVDIRAGESNSVVIAIFGLYGRSQEWMSVHGDPLDDCCFVWLRIIDEQGKNLLGKPMRFSLSIDDLEKGRSPIYLG